MISKILKNLSILKKFLFINFLIFLIISILTVIYVRSIQPSLIKNKSTNHFKIIDNTIGHLKRLNIDFNRSDIRNFFLSTKFLFQTIDRAIIFDNNFDVVSDTNSLDLDPRSFSNTIEVIEMNNIDDKKNILADGESSQEVINNNFLSKELEQYSKSKNLGKHFTFTNEILDEFTVISIKNISIGNKNLGFIAVLENANDIQIAINERKNFVIRTALIIVVVIFIFSYVLNRYFLKPIMNLVYYTQLIKEKSNEQTNIELYKNRNDEIGYLSKSMEEMTTQLQKRINTAENFSKDLVHEIRNPLASLKSASEIISESENKEQRNKLIKIVSHDVERIERLITDYSQMLKDEVAISSEKMIKIDLENILNSVVDDFNSIYNTKRGIKVNLRTNGSKNYEIYGIENRIEQIVANLLDNSVSFSQDNQKINIHLSKDKNNKIKLNVIDNGRGFKENETNKIFNRFYSNRPDKFGEHSGLGLNIVKNLVELHNGTISARNNEDKGANIEIIFPEANS